MKKIIVLIAIVVLIAIGALSKTRLNLMKAILFFKYQNHVRHPSFNSLRHLHGVIAALSFIRAAALMY